MVVTKGIGKVVVVVASTVLSSLIMVSTQEGVWGMAVGMVPKRITVLVMVMVATVEAMVVVVAALLAITIWDTTTKGSLLTVQVNVVGVEEDSVTNHTEQDASDANVKTLNMRQSYSLYKGADSKSKLLKGTMGSLG